MRAFSTPIKDLMVIEAEAHEDERGLVMETYRSDLLRVAGIDLPVRQVHEVFSKEANTVRGLNVQWDPPMAKLVRVTFGNAYLVAVDLRKDSPTLGKWFGLEANDRNRAGLYAPAGFARGAQTLAPTTMVQYFCSEARTKEAKEETIAWNDPEIGIDWPLKETPRFSKEGISFAEWLGRPESETFKMSV